MKRALVLLALLAAAQPAWAHGRHHVRHHRHHVRLVARGEVVSHPAGCPRIAFCGCGSSVAIFGHPIRSLYLAANWLRFPRAMAAEGMAVVFGRHHVAVIRHVNGDGTALLYDPNSGRHLTRIHTVDIRRATIVNPRGGRI